MEENKESNQDKIGDSVTGSIRSETFESWTFISKTSKTDDKQATKSDIINDDDNKIEILKDKHSEDDNKHAGNQDKENVDDLSDGISIISDSESAGRESPQPLRGNDFTNTINPLEFHIIKEGITCELLTPPGTPQQQSSIHSMSSASNTEDLVQEPEQQRNIFQLHLSPFRHFGISGLFLLSAFVALIAFVARLKYPEWYLTTQIDPLKQRVEDLELRNNLLRAEIDLLTKQVNYMTQESGKIKKSQKYEGKWSSEEDTSKEKSPEKQNFIKTEQKKIPNPDNPPENKEKFDGLTKTAGSLNDGSGESIKTEQPIKVDANQMKNAPPAHEQWDYKNSKRFDEKFDEKKYHRKSENYPPKYKDNGHYEEKKYDKNYKKYNSEEKFDDEFKKKDKYKSYHKENNNFRKDSSKERYDNSYNKRSSEEFKENFNDCKRKDDRNRPHDEDWHEKMMLNRENLRKKNGKYDTDNWYIERGNSREEARSYIRKDQKYRRD